MPDKSIPMGMNRTGADLAPKLSKEMTDGQEKLGPKASSPEAMALVAEMGRVRADYAKVGGTVGSMPPPSSLKGAAVAAKDLMKLSNPNVLLDKLGERLAFERTGTRLYDALLHKLEALGPTKVPLDEVRAIRDDEMRHFELLHRTLRDLGADPTVQTPCADVAGVEAGGIIQVLTDPRTNVAQALGAILVAELADHAGWELLTQLAKGLGHDEIAKEFQAAYLQEELHTKKVKGWLTDRVMAEANAKP